MLEITPLRYFLSAYETGSISRAAQVNAVSQPSVSAAIQRLERELGGSLFLRSRRGLVTTPLGEQLYREAAPSVTHLADLSTRLRPHPRQRLRIYCHPDVLLSPFSVPLQALVRRRQELLPEFCDQAEVCDIACVAESCAPSGYAFLPLWEEGYGVALPVGHRLAQAGVLRPEDIAAEPRIHRPYCPKADVLHEVEADRGMPPPHGAAAVNDQQVLDLVAAGLGIALVPLRHAGCHPGVAVRPLTEVPEVRRTVGLAYRKTVLAREIAAELAAEAKE